MRIHVVLRSVTVAAGLALSAYLVVVDYPFGTPLWKVLIWDAAGIVHELFYVWAFVLSVVALDAWYEWQKTLREILNAYLGLWNPGEKRVFRVCRRAPPSDRPSSGTGRERAQ